MAGSRTRKCPGLPPTEALILPPLKRTSRSSRSVDQGHSRHRPRSPGFRSPIDTESGGPMRSTNHPFRQPRRPSGLTSCGSAGRILALVVRALDVGFVEDECHPERDAEIEVVALAVPLSARARQRAGRGDRRRRSRSFRGPGPPRTSSCGSAVSPGRRSRRRCRRRPPRARPARCRGTWPARLRSS